MVLQATNNIVIEGDIVKTSGDLTLDAGERINFRHATSASITLEGAGATLTLKVGQVLVSNGIIRGFVTSTYKGTYSITAPNLVVEYADNFNLGVGLGIRAEVGETAEDGDRAITLDIDTLTIRSTRNSDGSTANAENATVHVAAWMFIDGVDLTIEATRGSVNFAAVGDLGTGVL